MSIHAITLQKRMVGEELQLQSLSNSALGGDKWSTSRPGRFTLWKEPCYQVNRSLGGSQSRYLGEDRISCPCQEGCEY